MSIRTDNLTVFPLNTMRTCLILIMLPMAALFSQSPDSLLVKTFPQSNKIFHRPPSPFFQGRPTFLELFVDIAWDSLKNVSIFFKTENSVDYQEISLEKYRGRFRFKYDSEPFPGDTISYFFMATETDFSLHVIPLDDSGKIKPVQIQPVDPIKYYESMTP